MQAIAIEWSYFFMNSFLNIFLISLNYKSSYYKKKNTEVALKISHISTNTLKNLSGEELLNAKMSFNISG